MYGTWDNMKKIFSLLLVPIPFAVLGYASDSQTNANIRDIANLHLVKLDKSVVVDVIGTPNANTVPSTLALSGTMITFGNNTSVVKKFNGRKGLVTPLTGDYTAAQVGAAPQPHFSNYSTNRSAEHAALGTAAYQPISAFDPVGAAAAVKDTTANTGILKGNGSVISVAVNSDLPAMSATVGGAVPTPPNDATKFLNGAAGFTVPAGTYSLPITDSVSTTSSTTAASATAVKSANDNANTRLTANQAITLSGDATGSGTTAITVNVGKINGDVVDNAARSTGDFLRYDGSQWRHAALVSGDIPNNAATTTGSAATLTTGRTINGVSFNGSANIQTATSGTSDYATGTFIPSPTGLTVVNGTGGATYAGNYTAIGNIVYFTIRISLTGTCTVASVAATSKFTGLPYTPAKTDTVTVVNDAISGGAYPGLVYTDGTVYLPTWTATNNNITVSGKYQK